MEKKNGLNIILILDLIKANAIEVETRAFSQVLSTDPILNELGQEREVHLFTQGSKFYIIASSLKQIFFFTNVSTK